MKGYAVPLSSHGSPIFQFSPTVYVRILCVYMFWIPFIKAIWCSCVSDQIIMWKTIHYMNDTVIFGISNTASYTWKNVFFSPITCIGSLNTCLPCSLLHFNYSTELGVFSQIQTFTSETFILGGYVQWTICVNLNHFQSSNNHCNKQITSQLHLIG